MTPADNYKSQEKPLALEDRAEEEKRLFSPSAARNRDVLREAFLAMMPDKGDILEIGAGTGEHAVHIAGAAPELSWQPSDPDEASRASIAAWTAHLQLSNIAPPLAIDVCAADWGDAERPRAYAGIVSANMIHIAPFSAAEGLFAGAGRLLNETGKLFLYGPFSRNGVHTAPSNMDFDQSLRSRDPSWGVRDLERDLAPLADKAGLRLEAIRDMPKNNFSVTFSRQPSAAD